MFATERDFSDTSRSFDFVGYVAAGSPDDESAFISDFGSVATPQGTILDVSAAAGNGIWDATRCSGRLCFNDPIQGWRPSMADDTYNIQESTYILTPSRRISFFSNGSYDLSENVTVFFEAGFTNQFSQTSRAPRPLFTQAENIVVSEGNRFNLFGRDFSFVARRVVELGPLINTTDNNAFRIVVGAHGPLPELGPLTDWRYELYGNFGRTEAVRSNAPGFLRENLAQALGPDVECTGPCVPLDLFNGSGSITGPMLDYVTYRGVDRGYTEQNVLSAEFSGSLFELVDDRPARLAFGYQMRRESGADIVNPVDAAVFMGSIEGRFEVHAGHAEVTVPVVASLPGAELLELRAAGRFVSFDNFGGPVRLSGGRALATRSIRCGPARLRECVSSPGVEPAVRRPSNPVSERQQTPVRAFPA